MNEKASGRAIPHPQIVDETHFVPYDGRTYGYRGRLQRAHCGKLVDPQREHAAKPTCPTCEAAQTAIDDQVF